jgi:hypothetical protein
MTGTAPAEGAACYTAWTTYSDDTCATAVTADDAAWNALKLTASKKADPDCTAATDVFLTKCDNGKITALVCSAATTGADKEIAYTKYDGTECVKVGDTGKFAKFTPAGWTAAPAAETANATNATNATGAKSLAAAVAAGALAVAATQF